MIVQIKDLTVSYRRGWRRSRFNALDNLNLEIGEGEFFALLGQNGAGKSTLMYCMLGLLRPTGGEVRVLGSAPRLGAPIFADIGYLPEEPHYHAYLTVEEAVTYYAALTGRGVARSQIHEILDKLGLLEHRKLLVSRCSKGMKQKVGIAQCVLHAPRLLFLDEPMRGLDPAAVHLFRDLLIELNNGGSTIIMSSHLLSEVELVATRVAILDRGRLLANDSVSALRSTGQRHYTVTLKGSTSVPPHYLDATVVGDEIRGKVAPDAFFDLMAFARQNDLRVVSCDLQRGSLEEGYLAIVNKEGRHA